MGTSYAPIDFFGEQFIIGSTAFKGFRKRELVRTIKGCGGTLHRPSRCSEDMMPVGLISTWEEADTIDEVAGFIRTEDAIVESTGLGLTTHERMSMLRGALQGEPSQAAWRFAVAVLEAWPRERGHADALRYIADLTRGWPAEVREGSPRWLKRALSGKGLEVGLIGSLTLRNGMFTPRELTRVLGMLEGLEHLRFELRSAYPYDAAQFEASLRAANAMRLESLSVAFSLRWPVTAREQLLRNLPSELGALEVRSRYVYRRTGAYQDWPFEPDELRYLDTARAELELRLMDRMGDLIKVRRGGVDVEVAGD